MNPQRRHYRSRDRSFGLCYYRYSMKYIGYIILAYSLSAFADLKTIMDNGGSYGLPGSTIKPGAGETGVRTFFSSIVTMLQDITAMVAVLGICIVGIMYIMSHGNEEKTEAAKKYIMMIITGVVLAFTAWAIISMIDLIPTSIKL